MKRAPDRGADTERGSEMVDILHRVGVVASLDDGYRALTTLDGLKNWWTETTTGDPELGGVLAFRFPPATDGFDMKVVDTKPAELVLWEVVDGPEEWVGTQIRFELKRQDDFTIVLFSHCGLAGAGRVHAPLQHEVGDVPDEPQTVRRDRDRCALAARRIDRQLELNRAPRVGAWTSDPSPSAPTSRCSGCPGPRSTTVAPTSSSGHRTTRTTAGGTSTCWPSPLNRPRSTRCWRRTTPTSRRAVTARSGWMASRISATPWPPWLPPGSRSTPRR